MYLISTKLNLSLKEKLKINYRLVYNLKDAVKHFDVLLFFCSSFSGTVSATKLKEEVLHPFFFLRENCVSSESPFWFSLL